MKTYIRATTIKNVPAKQSDSETEYVPSHYPSPWEVAQHRLTLEKYLQAVRALNKIRTLDPKNAELYVSSETSGDSRLSNDSVNTGPMGSGGGCGRDETMNELVMSIQLTNVSPYAYLYAGDAPLGRATLRS